MKAVEDNEHRKTARYYLTLILLASILSGRASAQCGPYGCTTTVSTTTSTTSTTTTTICESDADCGDLCMLCNIDHECVPICGDPDTSCQTCVTGDADGDGEDEWRCVNSCNVQGDEVCNSCAWVSGMSHYECSGPLDIQSIEYGTPEYNELASKECYDEYYCIIHSPNRLDYPEVIYP